MRKTVLIFGLIAGAIVAAMMFITMPMWDTGVINFDNGEIVGYTSMVIAFSMIFFAVKSYRDHHLKGVITFGKAFTIGILITVIASLMYAAAWEICYHTMAHDFMDRMASYYIENMKKDGATETELKEASIQMDEFKVSYKNPFIRFGYTLIEIFPVGLAITLICAALLRKKEVLPPDE